MSGLKKNTGSYLAKAESPKDLGVETDRLLNQKQLWQVGRS